MSIRTRFNPLGTIGRKGLLPAGYIELEYLESTGTQYIDTGIVPDTSTRWEVRLVCTGKGTSGNFDTYGTRCNVPSNQRFNVQINHTEGSGPSYKSAYGYGENSYWDVQTDAVHTYCIDAENLRYRTDGGQWHPISGNISGIVVPIMLFAMGNTTTAGNVVVNFTVSRCYYSKIWKNSKLVLNFIPALDPTGRPCMFDTVTQQPFYNKGTGEFKCGYKLPQGYTQVSAIYFNNATNTSMCYVDLGYSLKDGGILRTTLSCPSVANRWQFSGYYEPGEAVQWGVSPIVSGQAPVAPSVGVRSDILRGSVNDGLPHEYVIDLKNLKIGIDSNRASLTGRVTPRPYNVYLGNRNGSGEHLLNAAANMTLYSFFYKDASVKSVLVPCRDSSNNACLYDICRKVALYSSGNVPLQVAP